MIFRFFIVVVFASFYPKCSTKQKPLILFCRFFSLSLCKSRHLSRCRPNFINKNSFKNHILIWRAGSWMVVSFTAKVFALFFLFSCCVLSLKKSLRRRTKTQLFMTMTGLSFRRRHRKEKCFCSILLVYLSGCNYKRIEKKKSLKDDASI